MSLRRATVHISLKLANTFIDFDLLYTLSCIHTPPVRDGIVTQSNMSHSEGRKTVYDGYTVTYSAYSDALVLGRHIDSKLMAVVDTHGPG